MKILEGKSMGEGDKELVVASDLVEQAPCACDCECEESDACGCGCPDSTCDLTPVEPQECCQGSCCGSNEDEVPSESQDATSEEILPVEAPTDPVSEETALLDTVSVDAVSECAPIADVVLADVAQEDTPPKDAVSIEQPEATNVEPVVSSDESQPSQVVVEQHAALVEALVFACGEPVGVDRLSEVSGISEADVEQALGVIQSKYAVEHAGIELVQVAGRYQFRTKSQYASFLRVLKADAPRKLSAAALETLAIVAYRQPIVRSDMEKIRGVDVTPTLKTLLERGMVKIVGHQNSVGQPALYGTTDQFLSIFGLNSLSELPTLRDLAEVMADPGETQDAKASEAESATPATETEPQAPAVPSDENPAAS